MEQPIETVYFKHEHLEKLNVVKALRGKRHPPFCLI